MTMRQPPIRPLPMLWTLLALSISLLSPTSRVQAAGEPVEWPLLLEGDKGNIVIYEPQVESLEGNRMEVRGAISVTKKDSSAPIFGAVWWKAEVATDLEARTVTCLDVEVTAARFPDVEEAQVQKLQRYLEEELPQWDLTFSLDVLLASLERSKAEADAGGFHNEPPDIVVVEQPAVLVLIDGEPKFAELTDSKLEYVANSAFFIVREKGKKQMYLRGGNFWFTSTSFDGDWAAEDNLPGEVQEISKKIDAEEEQRLEEEEQAAKDAGEAPAATDDAEAGEADAFDPNDPPPVVIVRTKPTELIFTDGKPDFATLQGTQLLYMNNTESDVLMNIENQQYYVLLSGRWYTAPSLHEGPWKFIEPKDLPADFAKISEGSDMANVLTSVAGTQQAQEALLENSIPQTAVVDRQTATVTVEYDGDPKFESCTDNGVAYALNTDKSVLLIDGQYYCCDSAIWFESNGPTGPWKVSDSIPDAVQDIPPECPVYNVKYVYIYDSTPEVVYVGYTPAYFGSYAYGGVVIYGTGYAYAPWYATYYYPRPVTYGFHVHYSPWTGWGMTFGMSYGWLHIRVGRPYHGGYWGARGYHYGYRRGYAHGYQHGYRHGYNHGYKRGAAAGYRAGQRQGSGNIYRNRDKGVRATGRDQVARDHRQASAQGKTSRDSSGNKAKARSAEKKQPRSAGKRDNVYSDSKGNTYRKEGNDWQQRDNKKGDWSNSKQKPDSNVQRDQQNRQKKDQSVQKKQQSRPKQTRPKQSNRSQQRSRGGGRRR